MQVMLHNKKTNWVRGFYSKDFKESEVVEMEGSVICKMFLDKERGFGFDNYILIYNRNNEGWCEITKTFRLDLFLNKDFKYGFITEIKK